MIFKMFCIYSCFPGGSDGKELFAMQETLGREDPLEEDRAIRSSILVCRIPWREELGGL